MKKRLISPHLISRSVAASRQTKVTTPRAVSTAIASSNEVSMELPFPPKSAPTSILDRQDRHHKNVFRQTAQSLELDSSLVGLSGGEIIHELMLENDVEQIFGFPSNVQYERGHNAFDAIYKSRHLKSILPMHEQGAGHMAEGYARASGKPGVVLVTSGSGVTNMVTPMQDALCDGTPMVVLCGQMPTIALGNDENQETDVLGVTMSCTKWNIKVKSIAELPRYMNEAFKIAMTGRPGPVLIEIPKHVSSAILTHPIPKQIGKTHLTIATLSATAGSNFSLDQTLARVANLVNNAKKPILYVGQGMIARPEGAAILKEFADKASVPVTTSLQGLGAFDELDPKALHMLGLHGSGYANLAIQEADLIIALGARFDDRITGSIPKFAPMALVAAAEGRGGIVHFEVSPKNVNKVVQASEAVLGDCADNLKALIPRIKPVADRPEWFSQINDWKARFPLAAYKRLPSPGIIKAQEVIETLSDLTADMKESTIITTGVGQHQMFAAQHFRWRYPRTLITSGGLGTMGYGLPAAIGAKVAHPDCLVIDIDGDASFNMTMAELSTAARYNIGVKVLLCNNEEMGMVVDLQRLYYNERFHQVRQKNPDFVLAAQALGVAADRCVDPADMISKLKWLLDHDGPALLEVAVQKNSPVWPIVPSGKGLHEFITYPEVPDLESITTEK